MQMVNLLILPAASEAKQEESAANRLRQTDATFCRHQPALDCLGSSASRFSPSMRSRFRSSDTAGVAEGKTQAGTSEELCSLVQSFCSVDRNNRARDKKALLRQPGELHDSRSRSPSGTPDNAGNVIRPSLRESLCEERLHFQNYKLLARYF